MKLPLNHKDPNFKLVLSAKQAAAANIMTVQTRVDRQPLRPQEEDKIATVLQRIQGARRSMAEEHELQTAEAEKGQQAGQSDSEDPERILRAQLFG